MSILRRLAFTVTLAALSPRVAHAAVRVWVADESEKIAPSAEPPRDVAPLRVRLAAAGGECAGAQIVLRATERLQGLSASAAPLSGPRGEVPLDLYRVATIRLERPSGPEGAAGEWPDPLIPARDAIWGEPRQAFPIDVPAGRAQAIFLEACAPRGAGPGRASGSMALSFRPTSGSTSRVSVPVELKLRGFDLPATPPLATAFGFSGYSAAKGHGRGPEAHGELTRLYDTMALRRGITLFGGTQDAPAHELRGDSVRIDWTAYDAEVAPFLDGTALPSGARWTSVELREPRGLTRAQRKSWRRAWVEHFRARGWLDRLFAYVEDEPAQSIFGRVEQKARELREDAPELRRLVTTALSEQLPSVDLWVPLINCMVDGTTGCPRPIPRSHYRAAEAAGARLWWYQSCMSHGCSDRGVPAKRRAAFTGWPSYMIDAPATAARAMGALAFAQGIAGELYYDVVYAYAQGDPWKSQWAFEGNGDGTLYYPGTPERIGGAHGVPVESLRLVQIARGLQDHAYLTLCARLGDPQLAAAEARSLAPSLRGWARDPKAYAAARERLAARIEVLSAERQAEGPPHPAAAAGTHETQQQPSPGAR